MELVAEVYMMFIVDALHIVVTKVFHDGGKLLKDRRAWSYSSIFMSSADDWR